MTETRRVLVTGAAGGVARMVLPGLLRAYDVTLTDRVPAENAHDTVIGNLTDRDFVADVTAGVDAVIHLAANPNPRATWDELLPTNIIATQNILAADVPRVVLASSAHAMGQYVAAGRTPVDPDWPPSPCCTYGATKAFAEALGHSTHYRNGTTVVALRLGATVPEPPVSSALSAWLGPDDLRHLVIRALQTDVGFAVCHGISANTRTEWDVRNDIGYRPVQDSESYADRVPEDESWGACPT